MKRLLVGILILFLTACTGELSVTPSELTYKKPIITITFDDGYDGVYDYAYPILREYGISANIAIFTDIWQHSNKWSNRVTIPETVTLYESGWSILSHSVTHADLSILSRDSIKFEIVESKRILDSLHFYPTTFIMPYLSWNDMVLEEISNVYSIARCCIQSKWSVDTLRSLPEQTSSMNWYMLTGIDVSNYDSEYDQTYNFTTDSGRINLYNTLMLAVNNNQFVDVVFHNISSADTTNFRLTIEILNLPQFKPYIKTYNQIIKY